MGFCDSDSSIPDPPDFDKLYQAGIDAMLRNGPRIWDTELDARRTYDPARIADQQALQDQFGPTMYQQQLEALDTLDPNYRNTRELLRTNVTNDLLKGTELTPEQDRQYTAQFRGAQAARGNGLSVAAGLAEGVGRAQLGQQMYQQRLQNVGSWLSGQTPEQQLLSVQSVMPDRSMAYVNPGAGAAGVNFGQQNYQNMLAANQLQQQNDPWKQALGLAANLAGSYFGSYQSDVRLKENVREIAQTKSGIPLIVFSYIGSKIRYVGARAQDVLKVRPDAVGNNSGFLTVNYGELSDVPFFALEGENVWLT